LAAAAGAPTKPKKFLVGISQNLTVLARMYIEYVNHGSFGTAAPCSCEDKAGRLSISSFRIR